MLLLIDDKLYAEWKQCKTTQSSCLGVGNVVIWSRFNLQNKRNITHLLTELICSNTLGRVHIYLLALIKCYTCILIRNILLQIKHCINSAKMLQTAISDRSTNDHVNKTHSIMTPEIQCSCLRQKSQTYSII